MEMRRIRQQIPEEENKEILKKATSGVLCLTDFDNRPYGVPMSFIEQDEIHPANVIMFYDSTPDESNDTLFLCGVRKR